VHFQNEQTVIDYDDEALKLWVTMYPSDIPEESDD
jgi:hypothetical protein